MLECSGAWGQDPTTVGHAFTGMLQQQGLYAQPAAAVGQAFHAMQQGPYNQARYPGMPVSACVV